MTFKLSEKDKRKARRESASKLQSAKQKAEHELQQKLKNPIFKIQLEIDKLKDSLMVIDFDIKTGNYDINMLRNKRVNVEIEIKELEWELEQIKNNNLIIGGGITGLIIAFYTGKTIISKNVGGQLSSWSLGPRFLHNNKHTIDLLKKLNVAFKKKTLNIGFYDERFVDFSEDFRQKYYQKTRKTETKYIKSSMSSGKSKLNILEIDFKELIDKLVENVTIIKKDVKAIDCMAKTLTLDTGELTAYNSLIVTIPITTFQELSKIKFGDFKYLPKTFILTDSKFDIKDFDYVYFAGNKPWHRITKLCDKQIFEFVGNDVDSLIKDELNILDMKHLKTGQILNSGIKIKKLEDIEFVGRYAEWNHDRLIHDVIKRFMNEQKCI